MNLLLICVLIVMVFKIVQGYKRGMVKEIISFISLIVLCIVVVLIGSAFRGYMEKEFLAVVVAVLLLAILGILHHLLGVIFFSAKQIVKLPIIKWLDKILGMVVGVVETVIILWTVYSFVIILGLGMIGQYILAYTEDSTILSLIYQYNYLAIWVEKIAPMVPFLNIQ